MTLSLTDLDLNQNEIKNLRLDNRNSAPNNPVTGQIYFDESDNILKYYNGSVFINLTEAIDNHSELNLDDGTNPHGTTKSDVGLGNVDNTSDLNKPISTATQNALDNKQNLLNTSSVSVAGSLSNTDTVYVLMTSMQQAGLESGNYLFSFGGWMEQSVNQAEIFTQIYVNGTPVSGSEMKFKIGRIGGGAAAPINATHNYCNFPLNNIPNNATVEVRWRVNEGTGTINNRYFTIYKI